MPSVSRPVVGPITPPTGLALRAPWAGRAGSTLPSGGPLITPPGGNPRRPGVSHCDPPPAGDLPGHPPPVSGGTTPTTGGTPGPPGVAGGQPPPGPGPADGSGITGPPDNTGPPDEPPAGA